MKFNNDYYTANYHETRDEESKMKFIRKIKSSYTNPARKIN